jgi:type IV pilus assembly protein PilB
MIKRLTERKMGSILIEQGVIKQEQLNKALQIHNERKRESLIGEILVELGFLTEEDIIKAFLVQYKIPYLDIERFKINPETIDLVPLGFVEKYALIPLDKTRDFLIVAMANPLNIQALDELSNISHFKNFHVYIVTPSKIKSAIQEYYKTGTFPVLPHDIS